MLLDEHDRVTVDRRGGIAVYKPKPRIIQAIVIMLVVEAIMTIIFTGCWEIARRVIK